MDDVELSSNAPGDILFKEECYAIQGAVFEVYRELGCGFLEAVCQECLAKELVLRNVPFSANQELRMLYKGQPLEQIYRADFVCFQQVIVEIKAVKEIAPEHKAQILNYLKATGLRVGLLVNFGSYPKAVVHRFVV